jgi:hypothetical protein
MWSGLIYGLIEGLASPLRPFFLSRLKNKIPDDDRRQAVAGLLSSISAAFIILGAFGLCVLRHYLTDK